MKRTSEARQAQQQEALGRAVGGISMSNYPTILEGFAAKGIPMDDVRPRENVFTFNAWKALGRQVRKGEHGVKVVTFVPMSKADPESGDVKNFRRARTTTVFHISQTDFISC